MKQERDYDLLIRQSYHGTGGKEGYRFKVYDNKGNKIGELKDFVPTTANCGVTILINNTLYQWTRTYDSDNPRHERTEVMFHELKKFEFKPDFDLGNTFK